MEATPLVENSAQFMSIVNFTPVPALVGGLLIGVATILLMAINGRVAGVSGLLAGALGCAPAGDRRWRWFFVCGLVGGGLLSYLVLGEGHDLTPTGKTLPMLAGAAIVGFGTRLGSGCTSGHGICGLARFSRRSLAATVTFMALGFVTVFIVRHLL